jgi:hypothetical protein
MHFTEFENRYNPGLEADGNRLVGYGVVWNSRSVDLGGFREVIAPGAFDRTLKEFPDVFALVEHDTNRVLARTSNGTLKLTPDSHGLKVEIDPADTTYARDVLALVKRGDVHAMSFRFRPFPGGSSFDTRNALRTITSAQLKEVSVVASPAYLATEVAVRALDEAKRAEAVRVRNTMRLRLAAL